MAIKNEGFPLRSIKPSRENLLEYLRPLLTSDVIQRMAESDVGFASEVRANLKVLTEIRDFGKIPAPLKWNPAEVCNLLRWEKDAPNQGMNVMCLFAAWILICAYVEPQSSKNGMTEDGDEYVLVSLCEHAIALGPKALRGATALLYWAYLAFLNSPTHRREKRPFYLLSLLLLCSAVKGLLSPDEFDSIYAQLSREEAEIRQEFEADDYFLPGPQWVLGLERHDLNNFQNRFRNVLLKVHAVQNVFGNEKEVQLLALIMKVWEP